TSNDLTYVLNWLEALQIRLPSKAQINNDLLVTLSVSQEDWEIGVRCNKAYQINSKLPREAFDRYECNNSMSKEPIKCSILLNHFYHALKLHENVDVESCIISYDNTKEEINIRSNAQSGDGSTENIESIVKLLVNYENVECEPIQMDESNGCQDWCCIRMISSQLVVPLRTLVGKKSDMIKFSFSTTSPRFCLRSFIKGLPDETEAILFIALYWIMDQRDTTCGCPVSKDVKYHKKVLSPSFSALKASTTTIILVDAKNTLKLQMFIPIVLNDTTSKDVVAEFLCLPNIEPDDEDNE
ncbi:10097_t:CDS:2, partial [Ambispora gerdemannii]